MVNRDLVAAKLVELSDRIARAERHCPSSADALAADADALDLVSFNLMLAVQTCADIAGHIIADEGWTAARTLAEGFRRLAEHAVIDPSTSEALCKAVGLRNVVVHGYSGVNAGMVYAAATHGVSDLSAFAREVAAFLAER
ncbi:MAG TPA: DUF86 domain-containing protein [Polyangiaceae bacterium]|nr:DUF86 domain-containing protein [Polyangiaceae bacterium]